MALIGSLSSFVLARYGRSSQCSECLKKIQAHSYALTAFRHGGCVRMGVERLLTIASGRSEPMTGRRKAKRMAKRHGR